MKQTIYIDVLLAVNIFINYFLLLAAAKFLAVKRVRLRILAASILGAAYFSYDAAAVNSHGIGAVNEAGDVCISCFCRFSLGRKKTIFKIAGMFLYYEFCFCRIYDGNLVFYFSARHDYQKFHCLF